MEMSTFQAGDVCLDCQQHGLNNRLRIFFIDLNEHIVKCENPYCLYPYENDFSDSEDGKEIQIGPPGSAPNQIPGVFLPPQENQIHQSNDYDDTESLRFVEALLCSNSETQSNDKKGSTPADNAIENNFGLSPTTSSSFSLKPETFEQNSYSNNALDDTEGVKFIDSLLSDFKTENSSVAPETKLVGISHISRPVPPVPCSTPTMNYKLTNKLTNNAYLLDVKKERESKIDVRNGNTLKTKVPPPYHDFAKGSKPAETSKTMQDLDLPVTASVSSSNSSTPATSAENRISIKRCFEAIRERQEKLEKSNSKFAPEARKKSKSFKQRPRMHKQPNSDLLMNLIELVQTKKTEMIWVM